MCGIVGYVGSREAAPIIVEGLKRLEYRGYDSAGLAVQEGGKIVTLKKVGKVSHLESALHAGAIAGCVGMGHTRWATHGEPSEVNAHPHLDCLGAIAVIHNGVIENYSSLKKKLIAGGHQFRSETDTEVLSHLIEELHKAGGGLEQAVRKALHQVKGTYG